MVVPISPVGEKLSPQEPTAPSAPELSPTHDAQQPFGQLCIGLSENEFYNINSDIWRHEHLAKLIRRNQSKIIDNVFPLHDVNRAGFELYISYLDYGSIKFCNLEDALLSFETGLKLNCAELLCIATEYIDSLLNEINLLRVLITIAPLQRGRTKSNSIYKNHQCEERTINDYIIALRDNCKDVSKSCCKEILVSEEFKKLPTEAAREIFRMLDLSSIENGRLIITEGEFLMGPAKVLPKDEAEALHKLMKSKKLKLLANESKNHIYHLSSRTVHGCPITCDPRNCRRNSLKCEPPKVDASKREGKTKLQKVGFSLCRCWQVIFD